MLKKQLWFQRALCWRGPLAWLAWATLVWLGCITPAAAARLALVIGNNQYADRPLKNPVNDATDLKKSLEGAGFSVTLLTNADADRMKEAIADFGDRLAKEGDVGLFYFSGHGVQTAKGNYLLPLGRKFGKERDVELFAVEARAVLDQMARARNPLNIVILDACRDSPLPAGDKGAGGNRGLARMDAPSGSVIAYATAPGKTASDNGNERNGLYTKHLIKAINMPGLTLEGVFRRVGAEVEKANPEQSPEEVMKLRSETPFYFHPPVGGPRPAQQVASLGPQPVQGGLDLGDLQQQAQADAQREKAEAAALARMQADYKQVEQFSGNAKLKLQAWEKFLAAWPAAKAPGQAGLTLRAQADQQRHQAQAQAAAPSQTQTQATTVPATASKALRDGQVFRDCADCPEMVVVPAGRFMMGSPAGEAEPGTNEGPLHEVNIPSFAIGKHEVTQGEWLALMGNNPSGFKDCGAACPVEKVSWNDAQDYIAKLNAKTGQRYRLPSEAEWEYAARAGSSTPYPWGAQASHEYANYGKVECCGPLASGRDRWEYTAPVGSFAANAFGLHDMHGNVWEWVQDVWHDDYNGAPVDGSAWMSGGNQSERVLRGGSWSSLPQWLRTAIRNRKFLDFRLEDIGFRLARTVF